MLGKRKKYLIEPKFQVRFILSSIIVALTTISISFVTNYLFFAKFKKFGLAIGFNPGSPYFKFLEGQQSSINMIYLISSVAVFVLIVLWGIFSSHKIAGPIYKMTRHMREMAKNGGTERVRIRRSDHFQDLAESYNQQMEAFEKSKDKVA